jgi:hypothetical protein
MIAQQIQELELQAKNYDQNLGAFAKQMRVLNGVIFLKQNRKSWEDTPLGQIMGRLDLSELEGFVDQASAENSFQMDKFSQLLGVMENQPGREEELDEGVKNIVAEMERARAAQFGGTQVDQLGETPAREAPEENK